MCDLSGRAKVNQRRLYPGLLLLVHVLRPKNPGQSHRCTCHTICHESAQTSLSCAPFPHKTDWPELARHMKLQSCLHGDCTVPPVQLVAGPSWQCAAAPQSSLQISLPWLHLQRCVHLATARSFPAEIAMHSGLERSPPKHEGCLQSSAFGVRIALAYRPNTLPAWCIM